MSRSRMMKDDAPAEPNTPSPRTTIVGGRSQKEGAELPPVPTGLQRLLRLASVNEDFRQQLLERRAAVASAAEVDLSASEAAVLAAIPERQLAEMAQKMPPPAPPRREFLRQTAATAVVLLGGAALGEAVAGCGKQGKQPANGGPAPDAPIERPDHRMEAPGGAAPDEPPERPDHRMEAPGGAAPDEPPERPDQVMPTKGIQPDMPTEKSKQ